MRMDGFQISDQDKLWAIFVPILTYWVYSGIYVVLGSYLESYRLQTKEEEDQKNLVSKGNVIKVVLLLQFFQAIVFGLLFTGFDDVAEYGASEQPSFIIMAMQFITATLIMDTYLYFIHRFMHQNKFFYKHVHHKHHQLVVPYPYGALYNHPVEAFMFDTVGGTLAVFLSGMSTRNSSFFLTLATIKTVDDHCGLWLPWNIFHLFFSNNKASHYIHHQLYGTKYNFSTLFFDIWDRILGTHMPYSIEKTAGGGIELRPMKENK